MILQVWKFGIHNCKKKKLSKTMVFRKEVQNQRDGKIIKPNRRKPGQILSRKLSIMVFKLL